MQILIIMQFMQDIKKRFSFTTRQIKVKDIFFILGAPVEKILKIPKNRPTPLVKEVSFNSQGIY